MRGKPATLLESSFELRKPLVRRQSGVYEHGIKKSFFKINGVLTILRLTGLYFHLADVNDTTLIDERATRSHVWNKLSTPILNWLYLRGGKPALPLYVHPISATIHQWDPPREICRASLQAIIWTTCSTLKSFPVKYERLDCSIIYSLIVSLLHVTFYTRLKVLFTCDCFSHLISSLII